MKKSTNTYTLLSDSKLVSKYYRCGGNVFNVSSLHEFYHPVGTMDFAIKYVIEGTERYVINNQAYDVNSGSYLLLNGAKEGHVEIGSKKDVKGICIYITPSLITEIVASLQRPDTAYADPMLASFFYTDHFLENQYQSDYTFLGKQMQQLSAAVQGNLLSGDDIDIEFFYSISEKLIADQVQVYKQLHAIPTLKPATRRALYRKILRGREFIDAGFMLPLSIEDIARESMMSEYHFFRLFKKVFGISPHKYLLHKRLQAGKNLLQQQQTVSAAAIECGFADIYSFSKAFKSHFGVSPSSVQKKN
ncbi:MAG: AraC family transcriptional regulator [Ferruginibacter sp.]